jgi:hypothetical protein
MNAIIFIFLFSLSSGLFFRRKTGVIPSEEQWIFIKDGKFTIPIKLPSKYKEHGKSIVLMRSLFADDEFVDEVLYSGLEWKTRDDNQYASWKLEGNFPDGDYFLALKDENQRTLASWTSFKVVTVGNFANLNLYSKDGYLKGIDFSHYYVVFKDNEGREIKTVYENVDQIRIPHKAYICEIYSSTSLFLPFKLDWRMPII